MQTYLMSVLDVRSKDPNSEYVGVLVGCRIDGKIVTSSFPYKRDESTLLILTKGSDIGTLFNIVGELDTVQPNNKDYVAVKATEVIDPITDRVVWKAPTTTNSVDVEDLQRVLLARKQAITA